jgi:tetratricopeptide (TPR) repeat protein
MGEIYLSQGDYAASINEFNSISDRPSGQSLAGVALLGLYWNRIQMNDKDEANRVSQKLMKSTRFDDEKNLNQWMMAEMTFFDGRILDSLPFYFNIINTRFRETALVRIGEGYFFEKKFREAATNFDILLLEYPNSIFMEKCLFLKGESLFRLGEIGPALELLDTLLQKKTGAAWRLLSMIQAANIHLLQNAGDAAEQRFKQVIESFPNHPVSYYAAFQLGNLQFKKKNIGEAIHYYSLALKGNMLELAGEVYFRMGEIFYQQEKYEKALKNFEIAVQYLTETSYWFFLTQLEIGNLQRRWGQLEEAKKSYRIILDQSEDEDIRKAARELLGRLEAK